MTRQQILILGVFAVLICACAMLDIAGNFLGAYSGTVLADIGGEGLRSSIAALIGALSMLIGVRKDENH